MGGNLETFIWNLLKKIIYFYLFNYNKIQHVNEEIKYCLYKDDKYL